MADGDVTENKVCDFAKLVMCGIGIENSHCLTKLSRLKIMLSYKV